MTIDIHAGYPNCHYVAEQTANEAHHGVADMVGQVLAAWRSEGRDA